MKSTCCKATFHVESSGVTCWYECDACGKSCDVMDEAPALDQLREYFERNSMLKVPADLRVREFPKV